MFAPSCACTGAGTLAGSNPTLCGPPLTFVNLIASPALTVMVAGSKRYPFSSPTIFTSTVFPVAGAAAAAPAAGAAPGAAAAPDDGEAFADVSVAAGVVVVVVVDVTVEESVLVAFLSPPAHAPRTNTLARSARPCSEVPFLCHPQTIRENVCIRGREMLRVALPNKGRLAEDVRELFGDAGLEVRARGERALVASLGGEFEAILVRAKDIPEFVADGAADVGVTGWDLVCESQRELGVLLDPEVGAWRLV